MTDQDTFPVTLAGREILFKRPLPIQLIMLRRKLIKLKADSDNATDDTGRVESGSMLIVATLDVVESLIVDPADAAFLEEAMLLGKVGHEEVMDVLRMGQTPEENPKKKRATAAKAATKTTANRGRTKR